MVVSVVTGSVNVGYEQYDTRFKKSETRWFGLYLYKL